MPAVRAVIFDLGGTLVDWPDWEADAEHRWALAYRYLTRHVPDVAWPDGSAYVAAMRAAEVEHWRRVNEEHWSGPPTGVIGDGLRRLGLEKPGEEVLLAALDGYARAVAGWAVLVPGADELLRQLRAQGYRLGLLSNTWWAAAWHNADLAAHGLADLLDVVVYTSDLPHSKPHPSVFRDVAARLGMEPAGCVMVGDRMVDDVRGALEAGMRAMWVRNDRPWPRPPGVVPTAVVEQLAEVAQVLRSWEEAE